MTQKNFYKPRNTIAFVTKSKVSPAKNAYLRRFYTIRGRRLRREQGLFRRCVLVATTRKWTAARRFMRPLRQSVRSRNTSSTNKKAFGRPKKSRYRNRFYAKQQLRLFHGEVKEGTFRNFFRNHLTAVTTRGHSFFSALESRLDRVFFRRRLLPTIFACRQFITHQGLEVNSGIEKSPRALIRTGDRVAVSEVAWESLYWELLRRIYYRRWGLYIRRRRLFKQRKKRLFFVRRRSVKQRDRLNNFLKIAQELKINIKHKGLTTKKASFARLQDLRLPYNQVTLKGGQPLRVADGVIEPNQLAILFRKLFSLSRSSGTALQFISTYNQSFYDRYLSRVKTKDEKVPVAAEEDDSVIKERRLHTDRLSRFTRRARDRHSYVQQVNFDGSANEKGIILADKLSHYQKLALSLRLRKAALPASFRYLNKQKRQTSVRHHTFKRTKLLRFYFKKYKKAVQNQKRIRLKGVHFFIPSYLQIDFRTLRAVKVQAPSQADIYYPFSVSLAKRYSFYRSRGYLLLSS